MDTGCIGKFTQAENSETVYGCKRKFCKTSIPKDHPNPSKIICITLFGCPAATVNGKRWRT
jgi:hypothetical protein